jgi:hypothetical protein
MIAPSFYKWWNALQSGKSKTSVRGMNNRNTQNLEAKIIQAKKKESF